MRRVAVTGVGVVSPIGCGTDHFWSSLVAGRSGARRLAEPFASPLSPIDFAAWIPDFVAENYLPPREVKKVDRFIQFTLAATSMALEHSGLTLDDPTRAATGVSLGVAVGGVPFITEQWDVLKDRGARRVSPFLIPGSIPNMAAGYLGTLYHLEGPNITNCSACAAGTQAVGDALRLIQRGDVDVMIAGGAEALIHPLAFAGFGIVRALSRRSDTPEQASRPFDVDRDGFVLAEGAGILILEEFEHARRRGARVLAELTGFGLTGDGYDVTSPHPEGKGARRCMEAALRDARLNPSDLDYINAHGTSTPANDPVESLAIEAVFGEHARGLWVSSTKSMHGHALGAAGGLEAAACALALHHQVAPPTINLDHPDPLCRLDFVPHTAREGRLRHAMSNSFGFGGTNACVVFSRVDS